MPSIRKPPAMAPLPTAIAPIGPPNIAPNPAEAAAPPTRPAPNSIYLFSGSTKCSMAASAMTDPKIPATLVVSSGK